MKLIITIAVASTFAVGAYDSSMEVNYRGMHEVSGVASTTRGYLLVGDETNEYVLLTDGMQNIVIQIDSPFDETSHSPRKLEGFESIDSIDFDGQELTLILSEDNSTLFELEGTGIHTFASELWSEECGRGLEGLAIKNHDQSGFLLIAVLWEGGYAQTKDRGKSVRKKDDRIIKVCGDGAEAGNFQFPRIGVFVWEPGEGLRGDIAVYDVALPVPGDLGNSTNHQRFRGTDLVWHNDALLMLMGASSIGGNGPFNHTWLQSYCPDGRVANPVGKPKNLRSEGSWSDYFSRKNWEAMDWSQDGDHLVLGYDGGNDEGKLAVFNYSETENNKCETNEKRKKQWIRSPTRELSHCPRPADAIAGVRNAYFEVVGSLPADTVPFWLGARIEQWDPSNDPLDPGGYLVCQYSSEESGEDEFELLIRGPVDESSLDDDVWKRSSRGGKRIYTCRKDEPEDCTFDDFIGVP